MNRDGKSIPRVSVVVLGVILCAGSLARGQGWLVNPGFETEDSVGWTEWRSPWGDQPVYDYASLDDPYEDESSLYISSTSGSFGVYQEMCVEPDVPVTIGWGWKGASNGNGWWEVLIVDGPYSYEAVDDPGNHPETFLAAKWETGFGGPYPEPSPIWESGDGEITPFSDVITVVLKCGSTEGGLVEAWFDEVVVEHDTSLLEVTGVEPAVGGTAGGDEIRVLGRVFPEDVAVTLGGVAVESAVRQNTCEILLLTPPGAAGAVDVVVTTLDDSLTLTDGFRYVEPPVVTSITPSSGPVEGGTELTLDGENFIGSAPGDVSVLIGGSPLASLVLVDENTITGTSPPGAAGPVDVLVTTPFGEATLTGGFTYETITEVHFVRGDANSDGTINLTDGIVVLNFLFLGQAPPACMDAADVDDDGGQRPTLTDAIRVFNWLFTGGPAPLAPTPSAASYLAEDCGPDPSDDDAMDCAAPPAKCE